MKVSVWGKFMGSRKPWKAVKVSLRGKTPVKGKRRFNERRMTMDNVRKGIEGAIQARLPF